MQDSLGFSFMKNKPTRNTTFSRCLMEMVAKRALTLQ